jgi:hypothetical protein
MQQCLTLAKIIKWAIENDIEIKVGKFKEDDGLKTQIEITMIKNSKTSYVRFLDFEELDSGFMNTMVEKAAFQLCLTRLNLS